MTTQQSDTLLFKDQAGEYYVMPQVVLERGRVSAEAKAAIEAQFPTLRAIGTTGDDAQGHVAPIVAGAAFGIGCAVAGIVIGSVGYGDDLGPLLRAYTAKFGA